MNLKTWNDIARAFYESIGHKINMKDRLLNESRHHVITRDNALVSVDAMVYFLIVDAAKAVYVFNDLDFAIFNASKTNLFTLIASMTLNELF